MDSFASTGPCGYDPPRRPGRIARGRPVRGRRGAGALARDDKTMTFELALRLAAAFACGVAIGLERQIRQRTAGLRTITLVASGACLFVLLGVLTGNGTKERIQRDVDRRPGRSRARLTGRRDVPGRRKSPGRQLTFRHGNVCERCAAIFNSSSQSWTRPLSSTNLR